MAITLFWPQARLIQQLGTDSFAERRAASRALRKSAKGQAAEVCWRADENLPELLNSYPTTNFTDDRLADRSTCKGSNAARGQACQRYRKKSSCWVSE
jgi:hypothetical protein